jgi:hypothetical protein
VIENVLKIIEKSLLSTYTRYSTYMTREGGRGGVWTDDNY